MNFEARPVNAYELVFTDEDIAVSHTDIVKMDIKLTEQAVPVRAQVRPNKPVLETSLKEQIDSWLRVDAIVPAPWPPWPRRAAAPGGRSTTGS